MTELSQALVGKGCGADWQLASHNEPQFHVLL